MGKINVKDPFDVFSVELRELENPARDIYAQVCDRIHELKAQGKIPVLYERVVDLRQKRVQSLWKKIDSITRSKKFSSAKGDAIFRLLTIGLDLRLAAWRSDDGRDLKKQKETIDKIGKLAEKLYEEITTAKAGYVSDFIEQWAALVPKQIVDLDQFTAKLIRNRWAVSAWGFQREVSRSNLIPQTLLFGLVTLSKLADEYRPDRQNPPKSQVGMMSRRKSEISLFVIRLHVELERLFGQPHYGLNSDLSSLTFDEAITESRVEEIIERARARGEIRHPKSTKSPRR